MSVTRIPTPLAARMFAAVGLVVAAISAIGAVALRVLDPVPALANPFGFGDVALVGFAVQGVAFASVGALLVVRRPYNAVGWLMIVVGVGQAGSGLGAAATYSMVALGTDAGRSLAGATGALASFLATVSIAFVAIPFVFPTGRSHGPGWSKLIRIFAVPAALIPVMFAIQPGPIVVVPELDNPFGIAPDLRPIIGVSFSDAITAGTFVIVPVIVLAVVSRWRTASAVEREQIKWFLLASSASITGLAFAAGGAILSNGRPGEVGIAVFGFAGALVPVAMGIAILRHHIYDVDRLISRTVSYGVVTGVLGAVFVGAILLLQQVLAPLTQGQTIAVAGSTLAVFTLFRPVRARVQRLVDRRFDRARYDADLTAAAFSDRLRDKVDLASVTADLTEAARGAVAPARFAIWLRPRKIGS